MTNPLRKLPTPDLVTVPNPVAGSVFTFANDKGELLLVRGVTFAFTTSAAVANRFVGLAVSVDGRTIIKVGSMVAQTANLVRSYCAYTGTQSTADAPGGIVLPWRDSGILLRPGYQLAATVVAIDVGDTLTGITLDVLRFSPEYEQFRPPYVGDYGITDGSS